MGIKAIKSLGQNFLTDRSVAKRMVAALNLTDGDILIEIGPGEGVLTSEVLATIKTRLSSTALITYIAVEFDPRCVEVLASKFANEIQNNLLKVECANILDWYSLFIKTVDSSRKLKVLGSIPYNITSPILHMLCKGEPLADTAVLMIQKEVAHKIKALEPDNSYMSVFIQSFYDIDYLFKVDANKFRPVPRVDSAVVKLTSRGQVLPLSLRKKYEGFLHKAYANPRKMLNKAFPKEQLTSAGIDPGLRPQNISKDVWQTFFLEDLNTTK